MPEEKKCMQMILRDKELEKFDEDIFGKGKHYDECIDAIENCGYQSSTLLNLINDLLDFAKLEKMQF